MKDWAGFERTKEQDNAHRAAVAWYGGTANLNESQIPAEQQLVFRRLGDLEDLNDPQKSWFVPGHTKSNFTHGAPDAPWEGIGTGWFYSVNGGGSEFRPCEVGGNPKKGKEELGDFEKYLKENRLPVAYDNTYTKGTVKKRLRGDYAAPTVFNGNFELVAPNNDPNDPLPNIPIPGWSYKGNGSQEDDGASATNSVSMDSLVDWRKITTFRNERNKLGFEGTQLNYTIKLDRNNNQIVHNPQVVPDWGLLRFDVHAPGTTDEVRGELLVTLKTPDESIEHHQTIVLQKASNALTNGIPSSYEDDKYKIDYGRKGFESFFIPVPDRLRGQMVSIDLQLQAAPSKRPTVYVDNVFFQSNTLRFGNPTDARNNSSANYQNNYLIEKPQYTISFNKTRNTPNWVSSVFDGSWSSSNFARPQGFAEDSDLDGTGWYKVKQNDYYFAPQIEQYYSEGQYDDFVKRKKAFFWSDRGHLSAAKDKSRSQKDMNATFLTTNIFPQDRKLNRGMWAKLEEYLRNQFQTYQHKLYVISGVKGTGGGGLEGDWNIFQEFDAATNTDEKIQVPDRFWKVIMGFNKESPSEYPDYAFAVHIPNNTKETHEIDYGRVPAVGTARKWNDEKPNGEPYFIKSIWELEQILNGDLRQRSESFRYDFLSNVTDPVIKENIKKYKQPFPSI